MSAAVDMGSTRVEPGPCPAFKYVGGKRWLVDEHAHLLRSAATIAERGGTYREPFVGGGAVALGLYVGRCACALSDTNSHLIGAYRAIRDETDALVAALREMAQRYSRETFEAQRAALSTRSLGSVDAAVAFFVILMWGYNGLWRVNAEGGINGAAGFSPGGVPGTGQGALFAPEHVEATASDQWRLAQCCARLDARGVEWALSNSDTPETRRLWSRWNVTTLSARRSVNSDPTKRGPVAEILVRNFT